MDKLHPFVNIDPIINKDTFKNNYKTLIKTNNVMPKPNKLNNPNNPNIEKLISDHIINIINTPSNNKKIINTNPTIPNYVAPNPTIPNYVDPNHVVLNPTIPNYVAPNPTIPNYVAPNPTIPNYVDPNPTIPNPTIPNPTIPNPTIPNTTNFSSSSDIKKLDKYDPLIQQLINIKKSKESLILLDAKMDNLLEISKVKLSIDNNYLNYVNSLVNGSIISLYKTLSKQ
jgi:hypothetical protein